MKGLEKGTEKARTAGQKAAETRARNRELLGIRPKEKKPRAISVAKIRFRKLEESNYHKLTISTPVDIYIHKELRSLYISPNRTELTEKV